MPEARILFPRPLIEATILERPNRYVTMAKLEDGSIVRCYTPVGGRIGGLTIDGLSCLLSGPYEKRNTGYTVEAIRLENQWVGINQNASNGYVQEFLRRGLLQDLIPLGKEDVTVALHPERILENSRIDFFLDGMNTTSASWIEVKTPLISLFAKVPVSTVVKTDYGKAAPSSRMPKQMESLFKRAKLGERVILLGVFCYANEIDGDKQRFLANLDIDGLSTTGAENGVESWQIELSIDSLGVTLENIARIQ